MTRLITGKSPINPLLALLWRNLRPSNPEPEGLSDAYDSSMEPALTLEYFRPHRIGLAARARGGLAILVALACSAALADPAPVQTYRSRDGAFEFYYAASFIRCSNSRPDAEQAWVYWTPNDCNSQAALCGDLQPAIRTEVCVAFPQTELAGRRWFSAAAFYVAKVRGASTQNDCLQAPPPFAGAVGEEKDINGAKFKAFQVGDNWAGGGQRGTVYRGLRGGTCYR